MDVLTEEQRDERVRRSLELLPLLCEPRNVRLLAAVAYYQRAVRLLMSGHGPSEFAGEAIVNLAKCLEALFPAPPNQSRDTTRRALADLGYDTQTVERVFVKALALRSSMDAAHVRMATLNSEQRGKLQIYMENVCRDFRELLQDVADRVERGDLELATHQDRGSHDDLEKLLQGISAPTPSSKRRPQPLRGCRSQMDSHGAQSGSRSPADSGLRAVVTSGWTGWGMLRAHRIHSSRWAARSVRRGDFSFRVDSSRPGLV